jgi:hypothetical protein
LPTPFGLLINVFDSNHLPPVSASGSHLVPLYLSLESKQTKQKVSLCLENPIPKSH